MRERGSFGCPEILRQKGSPLLGCWSFSLWDAPTRAGRLPGKLTPVSISPPTPR